MLRDETAEKIAFLEQFKADIRKHFDGDDDDGLRTRISRGMVRAKSILAEAGVSKSVTLAPPAAIGGLIVRNGDPFSFILQSYYGMSMIPTVADMIEETIGVLESPEYERRIELANSSPHDGASASNNVKEEQRTAVGNASGRPGTDALPALPEKVTLSWLVQHVPVSFWLWLFGLLVAAFAAGIKISPLLAS